MNTNYTKKKMLKGAYILMFQSWFYDYMSPTAADYLNILLNHRSIQYKKDQIGEDGEFYATRKFIHGLYRLTEDQQYNAAVQLKKLGILSSERRGVPPKQYYKINDEKLAELFEDFSNKFTPTPDDLNETKIEDDYNPFKTETPQIQTRQNTDSNPSIHGIININKKSTNSTYYSLYNNSYYKENNLPNETFGELSSNNPGSNGNNIPHNSRPNGNDIHHNSPPQDKLIFVPPTVMKIINHWNDAKLSKLRVPEMKGSKFLNPSKQFINTVDRIKKVFRGELFIGTSLSHLDKKFTVEEILRSIDNFKLAVHSPEVEPKDKNIIKGLSLYSFFYNPFAKVHKSMFENCLNPPSPIKKFVDRKPNLTAEFKKQYLEKVIGQEAKRLSTSEEKDFVLASIKLSATLKDLHSKGDLQILIKDEAKDWVDLVFRALSDRYQGLSMVTTGHLHSDYTYKRIFPEYLKKIGIFAPEQKVSYVKYHKDL